LPSFIESTAGTIRKLAKLESLAVYFNTDSESMAGLPHDKSVKKFNSLVRGNKSRGREK
jgi:vacuolar protein sorting-associated protein 13A/C